MGWNRYTAFFPAVCMLTPHPTPLFLAIQTWNAEKEIGNPDIVRGWGLLCYIYSQWELWPDRCPGDTPEVPGLPSVYGGVWGLGFRGLGLGSYAHFKPVIWREKRLAGFEHTAQPACVNDISLCLWLTLSLMYRFYSPQLSLTLHSIRADFTVSEGT